ncbi:MAG TPA: hypothetical protein VJQ51_06255 [Burkholderiales bacterium]|nr:hypothetical protein [Burkholderiales bacterium]
MDPLILRISKTLFPRLTLHWRAYHKLIGNKDSYLYRTGWMQSLLESKPTDSAANPIPWMNYSVIKLLDDRLRPDFTLFEFGSGYSTRFYAKKVGTVVSLEYDEQWFRIVKADMPENVKLLFKHRDVDGEYCRVIHSAGISFDVVVVDGRDRVNCVKQAVSALSPRGVILLDDSQQEKYREASEFASAQGFRALDLEGLKATGKGMDRTTLFYRDGNCLGI